MDDDTETTMTPVDQVRDFEWGDCLQACLASVLDLKLNDVPDFIKIYGPKWFTELCVWLGKRGKYAIYVSTANSLISYVYPQNLYWIGVGDGPRGVRHAVVCLHNEVVHDPHTSRGGLEEIEDALVIVP
jgi:hypothetical protein